MNRNTVYLVIGGLVAAVAVLAYMLYQERKETTSIEIKVDKGGISSEKQ